MLGTRGAVIKVAAPDPKELTFYWEKREKSLAGKDQERIYRGGSN